MIKKSFPNARIFDFWREQQAVVDISAKKEKTSPVREKPSSPTKEDDRVSPVRIVERAVEARADADQLTSMVRSLYFCQTYPINGIFFSKKINFLARFRRV